MTPPAPGMADPPFLIGLTGSIGMGKSTAAGFFVESGAALWDADATVHRLYAPGGAAVGPVAALCPEALVGGAIDRGILSGWLRADGTRLPRLEAVIHPLVAAHRAGFLEGTGAGIVVLDIPLLFENGTDRQMDLVAVVSAPAEVQRNRVLARPGMTPEKLEMILARQLPDAEKRLRADVVIPTAGLEETRAAVFSLMADIRAGSHARNRLRHRDNRI